MLLAVKTIVGKRFTVEVEVSDTIGVVKSKIEGSHADLPAAQLKLIHKARILKDHQTIEELGLSESDFIVCHKQAARRAAPAPAPAAAAATPTAAPAPAPAATAAAAPSAGAGGGTPAPAAAEAPGAGGGGGAAAAAPGGEAALNPDHVNYLLEMGITSDRATVEAALRAAMGNPELAVEFLVSGNIPQPRPAARPPAGGGGGGGGGAGGGGSGPLQRLRNHPQFNQLRQLVQSNPGALSQVLATIGQQDPELLELIHQNQADFIAMMNEEAPAAPAAPAGAADAMGGGAGGGMGGGMGGMPGMPPGMNPAALTAALQNLPPEARAQMAQMMGLTPEQLAQLQNMISAMPPEQLNALMGAMGGAGGMPGGMPGGGGGGPPPGAHVVRLTEEEAQAVSRLTEMGFAQEAAIQAYLACDRDFGLAANLLMDGGLGFDDAPMAVMPPAGTGNDQQNDANAGADGGNADGGNAGGNNADDDEDMYG